MPLYEPKFKNLEYREALLDAASTMDYFIFNLFSNICGITMTGELKEWSDSIPDDEMYEISEDVFEACDDINIKACMELMYAVEKKFEYLLNINAMTKEEVNKYRDKKFNEMVASGSETDVEDSDGKDDKENDDGLPF